MRFCPSRRTSLALTILVIAIDLCGFCHGLGYSTLSQYIRSDDSDSRSETFDDNCRPGISDLESTSSQIKQRVCNPDQVLNPLEAEEINVQLSANFTDPLNEQCSRTTSCSSRSFQYQNCLQRNGLKEDEDLKMPEMILIVVRNLKGDDYNDYDEDSKAKSNIEFLAYRLYHHYTRVERRSKTKTSSTGGKVQQECSSKDACLFPGCKDVALMLYSADDAELQIVTGNHFITDMKSSQALQNILNSAQEFFGPGRDVARGLRQIIRFIRMHRLDDLDFSSLYRSSKKLKLKSAASRGGTDSGSKASHLTVSTSVFGVVFLLQITLCLSSVLTTIDLMGRKGGLV